MNTNSKNLLENIKHEMFMAKVKVVENFAIGLMLGVSIGYFGALFGIYLLK